MAEMTRDVLANGMEEACSEVFPGRGDYAFSPGLKLPSTKESNYEWVQTGPSTQRLVKRTSPR